MSTFRAFIAIHLPEKLKAYLNELNHTYAAQVPQRSVRWVKPAAMHLTLRFLGDTPRSQLATLQSALDQVGQFQEPFTFQLDRLGCFPNKHRPRVIWAGVQGDSAQAETLKDAVDIALEPLGWEKETRPFSPHLTLGRVKHSHKQIQLPFDEALEPLTIPVTAIHLVESDLRPDGPHYTTRHTVTLSANPIRKANDE